jgi:hypothetical protein
MLSSQYERLAAERALADLRARRRSATPEMVARVCQTVGYTVNQRRGKGSHWLATRAGAPAITIPTGNKVLGLKTVTGILTTLEEVFDHDGSS